MARVDFFNIVKSPRMTDKAAFLNKAQNKIVVDVDLNANKKDIPVIIVGDLLDKSTISNKALKGLDSRHEKFGSFKAAMR